MNWKLPVLAFAFALMFAGSANAQTLVTGVYDQFFPFSLTDIIYDSCNDNTNWQAGDCSYIYACYMVIPKGDYDINHALIKECKDVTDQSSASIHVQFIPPRGKIYAVVPFITQMHYTYDNLLFQWNQPNVTIPKRQVEAIVTLCPDGEILKDNLCFHAEPFCLDTFNTNMCNNPYDLYFLDLQGDGFANDYGIPSHACADRDQNKVCDGVASMTCSDVNANGVCDADDTRITQVWCVDSNQNGVCDNVESSGTFCRTNFNPVCDTVNSITYPNDCFAMAAGVTSYTTGLCAPLIQNLCFADTDCPPPCNGVVGLCQNPDSKGNRCFYAGQCNPSIIQCSIDTDCPAAPCVGISPSCDGSTNRCNYNGQCITQPSVPPTFWDYLVSIWTNFIGYILTSLGW